MFVSVQMARKLQVAARTNPSKSGRSRLGLSVDLERTLKECLAWNNDATCNWDETVGIWVSGFRRSPEYSTNLITYVGYPVLYNELI